MDGDFSQGSEGGFVTSSPYLSPISPCSVCLYLRHLCGGDQSRTSQMSVCIAQAAPHAWRRQISAVRPAWREMIHTDTQITSTSCSVQPSQQFKRLQTFVIAEINISLYYIFVLRASLHHGSLWVVMIYWWDCKVKVVFPNISQKPLSLQNKKKVKHKYMQ